MKKDVGLVFLTCLLSTASFAAKFGVHLSLPLKSTEPTNLHGYQLFVDLSWSVSRGGDLIFS